MCKCGWCGSEDRKLLPNDILYERIRQINTKKINGINSDNFDKTNVK